MNTTPSHFRAFSTRRSAQGFALIEVLVAAVILAAGLVSLALLQMHLTQITSDGRERSVATRLATEQVESMRDFTDFTDYQSLNSSTAAQSIGNIGGTEFTRSWVVRRYRYNPDPNNDGSAADATFQLQASSANTSTLDATPEFKRVSVTVGWTSATGQAKNVVVEDMISSATPRDGISTAKPSSGDSITPQVRIYKPTAEGVIPIAIGDDDAGNGVSAASSNPKPKQYADGATGSTKFTVQTYVSDQTNPLLQRQVDFAYASCSCQPSATNSTDANPAYSMSYWNGLRYVSPKKLVGVPIGVRNTAVDQDPQLCDTCCRDHHDSPNNPKADPFRPTAYSGTSLVNGNDHAHFDPIGGDYATAITSSTGIYSESCKLVRVDGVYRVASDSNLEDLTVLRMNRTSAGVASLATAVVNGYASFAQKYVTEAVNNRTNNSNYPIGGLPDRKSTAGATFELDSSSTYGSLFLDANKDNRMSDAKDTTYNFAARGLYIDYLSQDALDKIACINDTVKAECAPYKNMSLLEFVPFVAINLTDLAHWGSSDITQMVVRSDPIPLDRNGNSSRVSAFVRGQATAVTTNNVNLTARITRSNAGLVDTVAVDAHDLADFKNDQEEAGNNTNQTSPLGSFTAQIVDSTANRNFSAPSVLTQILVPVTPYPICVRGDTPSTNKSHLCVYDRNTLDITIEFMNYNYKSCSSLGTKWAYDQANDVCVLPPQTKTDPIQYGTPTVRDFELCTLSSPTGKVKVTTRTVINPGTATESTRFVLDRNGQANMGTALDGSSKIFNATFKMSCP